MKKHKHDWQAIINGHGTSGLTITAYCKKLGVPISGFYKNQKLKQKASTPSKAKTNLSPPEVKTSFAEVSLAPSEDEISHQPLITIKTANGVVVEIRL